MPGMRRVAITVDLEPDCPPFMTTWRGMQEGAPRLLDLLRDSGVGATIFVTGETAERFPCMVETLVADGHELGCHGMSHRSFASLSLAEAEWEVRRSHEILCSFARPISFRAPYLRLPEKHLPIVRDAGFRLDSSLGRYKPTLQYGTCPGLVRIAASVPPSLLRLPSWLRNPCLAWAGDPLVLFVHPWEFVDVTRERLPLDCRFRTGEPALRDLGAVIRMLQSAGAQFLRMRDLLPQS